MMTMMMMMMMTIMTMMMMMMMMISSSLEFLSSNVGVDTCKTWHEGHKVFILVFT